MQESRAIVGRAPATAPVGFTSARLSWLIQLRWVALAGILVAAVVAAASDGFPGVNWPVLGAVGLVAAVYNATLAESVRRGSAATDRRAAMAQALIDFLLLTVVLWAAGGLDSPFVGFYVFHVALVGILSGPRATLLAAGFALGCAGVLWLTEVVPGMRIGYWRPVGAWGPFADATAYVFMVGAVAYLVTNAVGELRDREQALEHARASAELEYELLSNTLNELDAGLEVVDSDHRVVWKNRLARRLVPAPTEGLPWACPGDDNPCERDASGMCPIRRSIERGEPGRCRFAFDDGGGERVYELLSFPLSADVGDRPRMMNLYLDRTSATLAERQLVLAERLASLGRIAQGVAHELNTPLATIQTLARDMSAALGAEPSSGGASQALLRDVNESATLITEETARLGRITQALLAGGDLVRSRVVGSVPLSAVVERSKALVFAGVRSGPSVAVDPSVDAVRLTADPDRLVQVLVNLLQNAVDALRGREDGHVVVRAEPLDGGQVRVVVEDDGPGLDEAILSHLFEPFTTTKPPGEGTGLGLYTSYMLARAMQGALALERRPGGGTRATIRLPAEGTTEIASEVTS